MSFSPIAFTAPNYRDFKNYWVKPYEPGTTTPKLFALESDGGTQVVKLEINKDGFLVSAGAALVIPYINGSYDLWMFPTEAEADANDTSNALRIADDIIGASAGGVKSFDTLAVAILDKGLVDGDTFKLTNDRGNSHWNVVLKSGVTISSGAPAIGDTVASTGDNTLAFVLEGNGIGNVIEWGLINDGVTSQTGEFASIYTEIKALNIPTHFPAGSYLGSFTFDAGSQVSCAGIKRTFFVMESTTTPAVKLFGTGVNAFNMSFGDASIINNQGNSLGIGLECGDVSGAGFSTSSVKNLEISGFNSNWRISSAIMCSFKNIWSKEAGDLALEMAAERNVTTCHFDTCRLYTSKVGMYLQAGHVLTFTNCNFESNSETGIKIITGITSGATKLIFNGCWIEDNGASGSVAAVLRAAVYIDMQEAVSAVKPHDILFNRCVLSSVVGSLDISAVRAKNIVFDHCAMNTTDGLTSTKLSYNTGTNQVSVKLIECGKVQLSATEAMYSSFPALTRVSNNDYGFFYEFTDIDNGKFSNTDLTRLGLAVATANLQSFDVKGIRTIVVDTSVGNRSVLSLLGGVNGQVIRILKTDSSNTLTIVHNGAGNDKIFLPTSADVVLSTRAGYTLVHYNGIWYAAGDQN